MKCLNMDLPENAPIRNPLTPDERRRLVELHHERGRARQAEARVRLAQALALAQLLNEQG